MRKHISDENAVQLVVTFEDDEFLLDRTQATQDDRIRDMKTKETTLIGVLELISDEKRAEAWFAEQR